MKTIIKLIALLLIIGAAGIGRIFLLLNRASEKIPDTGVEFKIRHGDFASKVAKRLKEEGYITSIFFFKVMTRLSGMDKRMQSGYIRILPGEKTTDIISDILNGKFETITFTIPEGLNFREIKAKLMEEGILSENEILEFQALPDWKEKIGLPPECTNMEGFLFPETYTVRRGAGAVNIFRSMTDEFYSRLRREIPDYNTFSARQFYERVILASIIEKEVRAPEEAATVAGVFLNRIEQSEKLQSCATVQYALGKTKERLLESDLLIESSYNTYINRGLPPTPISSPGINALKAAFHPAETDYMFFVVKDPRRGTHQFSRTYEEHLKAQERYKSLMDFK